MSDDLKKQPTSTLKHFLCRTVCNMKKKLSQPRVAVLRLQGVIGHVSSRIGHGPSLTFQDLADDIDAAFSVPRCKAVALIINSPGGAPVQAELIYKHIRMLSVEKNIPVITFIEDVAASGGYWLSCAGEEIFASENSIIGSIGVIASGFGFHEAIKKLGIERRIFTQGNHKTLLDPFEPTKEDDIERLFKIQKDIHDSFKQLVSSRREGKISHEEDLFAGDIWTGKQALQLGLIDGISDMHSTMKERFGEVNFCKIGRPKGLLKKLLGATAYCSQTLITSTLELLEERAARQRIGL